MRVALFSVSKSGVNGYLTPSTKDFSSVVHKTNSQIFTSRFFMVVLSFAYLFCLPFAQQYGQGVGWRQTLLVVVWACCRLSLRYVHKSRRHDVFYSFLRHISHLVQYHPQCYTFNFTVILDFTSDVFKYFSYVFGRSSLKRLLSKLVRVLGLR